MNGLIAWFARNGVPANMLMVVILAGGLFTLPRIRKEVFPEFASDFLTVTVAHPGASPEEIETAICIAIEEAVEGVDGVKRVTSTAVEGMGAVSVELLPGRDARRVLDEVKSRVGEIRTLPREAETPVVQEVTLRRQVINVAVHGPASEASLKEAAERVRNDLLALPGITQVETANVRPDEISIEIREEALLRHGLTFRDVAEAVRRGSLDLPGGSVKTEGGEILLRTAAQARDAEAFRRIPVLTRPDGARVLLADIAEVVDGFADLNQHSRFDGEPAALVKVYRVADENVLAIAEAVERYAAQAPGRFPEGIRLTPWQSDARILESRLDLLIRNGRVGIVLVFGILVLFLKPHFAFWVTLGIPVSFLGALGLMPTMDLSVNLISLFAFLLVLGIVVDDAIVIGESIYERQRQGLKGLEAAIAGAQEVALPVVFSVLTTVVAFLPLLAIPGNMGKFLKQIPMVAIAVLVFSLIESALILPYHLSRSRVRARLPEATPGAPGAPAARAGRPEATGAPRARWSRFQDGFAEGLERFVDRVYQPFLERCIAQRYAVLATGVAAMLVTFGAVAGGWIGFRFFPKVEADNVVALVTMPQGTDVRQTRAVVERIEEAARRVRAETESGERPLFRHVMTSVGSQPFRADQDRRRRPDSAVGGGGHLGEVNIELVPSEKRAVSAAELARAWREACGPVPDAEEVIFTSALFSTGDAIHVRLLGEDIDTLREAAGRLKAHLAGYAGVHDVADSFLAGKKELQIDVTAAGESLGIRRENLARAVRGAFWGEEAQRIQRGREDIRIMVRYPEEARRSLGDVETLRLRSGAGAAVPFPVVAQGKEGRGAAAIQRADRLRRIDVTSDVDPGVADAGDIVDDLKNGFLPEMTAEVPGLRWRFEGEQRERAETMGGLLRGFLLALLLIYALLAIPFGSHLQPLIVMAAIPFGLLGAVAGHVLLGMDLTFLSVFGIVALTGVVVNDSLVLVVFINRARDGGTPIAVAIREAGAARFRPILLTSLTTFAGLTPIILERSLQAQFLIPMAVSLGFGVLFATGVTLVLIPALYAILEDVKALGEAKRE